MTTLTTDRIESLRQRRSAGENLSILAREAGLSWQRLWGLLNPPGPAGIGPVLRATGKGALTEKYRPLALDAIWGQDAAVRVLRKFAADPYPRAFMFEGETGTGKTSAAMALAAELGCDLTQRPQEFGGVHSIASGEQTAETVRETRRQMYLTPFCGSGWKVFIVNEADRMALPAETIWLDVLEDLPARTAVIFTTNNPERLSQRFKDRCTRLYFESDAATLRPAAERLVAAIWKAETGKACNSTGAGAVVEAAQADGQLSFRRVVQQAGMMLSKGW